MNTGVSLLVAKHRYPILSDSANTANLVSPSIALRKHHASVVCILRRYLRASYPVHRGTPSSQSGSRRGQECLTISTATQRVPWTACLSALSVVC